MAAAKSVDVYGSGGTEPREGDDDGQPDVEAGRGGATRSPRVAAPQPRRQRLVSIDVFRGITVAVSYLAFMHEHDERMVQWSIPSLSLLPLGFSLDLFGLRMNKSLYSLRYTCVTAGTAGLLFTGIYLLVDVYGYKRPAFPMEWMGKHALMFFILAACDILPTLVQGFYWREPNNNLLKLTGI